MISIHPLPLWTKVADALLAPLMRLLSGAPFESPQETHPWHILYLDQAQVALLDKSLTVFVLGDEVSLYKKAFGPLFHLPLLGGWREYLVLETTHTGVWHVGWLSKDIFGDEHFHLNRLALTGQRVRVLKGPEGMITTFFALDSSGNQIPISVVGEGRIGDGKYPDVRLL